MKRKLSSVLFLIILSSFAYADQCAEVEDILRRANSANDHLILMKERLDGGMARVKELNATIASSKDDLAWDDSNGLSQSSYNRRVDKINRLINENAEAGEWLTDYYAEYKVEREKHNLLVKKHTSMVEADSYSSCF